MQTNSLQLTIPNGLLAVASSCMLTKTRPSQGGSSCSVFFFLLYPFSVMFSSSLFTLALCTRPIMKLHTTAQKLAFATVELAQSQATDVA